MGEHGVLEQRGFSASGFNVAMISAAGRMDTCVPGPPRTSILVVWTLKWKKRSSESLTSKGEVQFHQSHHLVWEDTAPACLLLTRVSAGEEALDDNSWRTLKTPELRCLMASSQCVLGLTDDLTTTSDLSRLSWRSLVVEHSGVAAAWITLIFSAVENQLTYVLV